MIAMLNQHHSAESASEDSASWQIPSQQLRANNWEVIVAGAGPAGSTLARCLAAAGHRVLLLDRQRFPRDKVCGDALIPDALNALRRAGLYDDVAARGQSLSTISAFSPSRIEVPIAGEYITLKRVILDEIMARGAVRAGAVLATGTVDAVESIGEQQVSVGLRDALVPQRARIAVIATGADVGLLKQLGMVTRTLPSALAVRRYVKSRMKLDRLIVSYDRRVLPGYGWIFPLGADEYNVGCGMFLPRSRTRNLEALLSRFLEEFPLGRQLMAEATWVGELRGAPLRCGLKGAAVSATGNIIAIGESIGATFPFTGEGIGKAMETAEIAAQAIHHSLRDGSRDKLTTLPGLLQARLAPKYLAYETAQKWISRSWTNDFIAWRAKRSKYMQRALEEMIADRGDARGVFSFRSLVHSVLN